jgi:hypothetical protein
VLRCHYTSQFSRATLLIEQDPQGVDLRITVAQALAQAGTEHLGQLLAQTSEAQGLLRLKPELATAVQQQRAKASKLATP